MLESRQKEIENIFSYHSPTEEQAKLYMKLREKGKELAFLIEEKCPSSREKSIAMTKLQEVIMFANASIAINK